MYLDIQNFTESLGINRIRPLAKDSRRVSQSVRPGPGHKPQATSQQATSNKRVRLKPQATNAQATSNKPQALGRKAQASSHKRQAP